MAGRSRLSLRTLAVLLITAIGLMLIAQSTTLLLVALPGYFAAQRVVTLTHADQVTFKTLLYRSLSDGSVIAALNAEPAIDDREAGAIAENRHLAETVYPETVAVLRELDLQGIEAVLENLRFASAAWAEVSAKADAATHMAKSARDRPSTVEAIARATAELDASQAASEFVAAALAPIDPVADRLLEVRRTAWSMRDHLQTLFRLGEPAANDGKPLPADKIIARAGRRGEVAGEWQYLTGIARRADTPQPLINAIANAGQWYVGVNQADQPDPPPASQAAVLSALADIATTATQSISNRADELLVDASRGMVIGGMSLVIAAVVTLVALLICRQRIGRPLLAMTGALRHLAERDPAIELPAPGHGEEIDVAANAMLMFCAEIKRADDQAARLEEHDFADAQRLAETDAAIAAILAEQTEKVAPLAESLQRLAEGDLTCQLIEPLPAEFETLREYFNEALGFLQATMRQVLAHIDTIRSNTNFMADEAEALTRRTGSHSATLRQALGALDALAVTVDQTQANSAQAQQLAAIAADQAVRAAGVTASCAGAVGTIAAQTQGLGGLAGVLDELAFAINVAGLKAGVDAARTGARGSGLAGELAALSQRAGAVAGELTRQVETATQHATDSTRWVRDAGRDFDRIQSEIGELNARLERCLTSARTQVMGLEAFRALIEHIEQLTQQNLAAAEQSTQSAAKLADESDTLKATMWRFRVDIETETPRAAA